MGIMYLLLLILLHFCIKFCSAVDYFTSAQLLKDSDSIVSNNSMFRLGFFSPTNTTSRYVGIWYNRPPIKEVIWVANRNNPITDSTGVLKISENGILLLTNGKNETLWSSSNVSHSRTRFLIAQLENSGNFVLKGSGSKTVQENGTVIWQSFEHPTDTVVLNMRITLTKQSTLRNILQSWNSSSDPSDGRFTIGTNSISLFEIAIWDGDRLYWRSGPWNGNIFIGVRYHNTGYGNIFVNSGSFTMDNLGGTTSLVFVGANQSLLTHYALSYQGIVAQKWWDDSNKDWEITWEAPETTCDMYGTCGAYGSCDPQNSPICGCLKGFEPKNKEEWKRGNWKSGCVRKKQLQCEVHGGKEDGFLRLQNMKVPDNAEWTVGLNKVQCRSQCLSNCSCLAYAYDTGIACLTWSGTLVDIAVLAPGGEDLYLRLPSSELGNSNTKLKVVIAMSVMLGVIVIAAMIWFLKKWRAPKEDGVLPCQYRKTKFTSRRKVGKVTTVERKVFSDKSPVMIEDLLLMKFEKVVEATNNFDNSNMLGKGGFGQVYKGTLEDGKEVAIKRLSRVSGQGIEELMNEMVLISKLQHRNLVKLLGCCVEEDEKLLIYEYMPNKSLDAFLFDLTKRELLQWETRFKIIEGICRGLLYLHRDSRLRIIHRDLKASNILLDEDLNPKISDFGMARIFGCNQDQANTERVVGTYGYMSPEYAMEGQFSEKSDVFSFGVLLLEIITGKRNSSFWYQEDSLSLLGYAWKLWSDDNIVQLIDPLIPVVSFQGEIVRCIHVGLLCVQEFAKERPNISTVMSMLVSEIVDLPNPKPPGFIQRQISSDQGSSSISDQILSINYATDTGLSAR